MLYSRLNSSLTIIVLIMTLGMFFYTQKGLILFIPFILVAVLAFILWLSFNIKNHTEKIIIYFIVTIMGLIILNMLRFIAGFASIGSTLFNAAFLLGAYFLLKRSPIGTYMAWFVFLWSIFQGCLQFYMAFVLKASYVNYYYLGIGAGIIVLILGLSGIYFTFKPNVDLRVNKTIFNTRLINLWTAFSLNIAVLYSIIVLSSQPYPTPELILFWTSLIIGIVLWRNITAIKSTNTHKILPLYLIMLTLYMLYTQETEIGQYQEHVAILFKINPTYPQLDCVKLILMLFGVISLYKQKPIGNLIIIVSCINIILTQPIVFLLFPIVESIKNNYPLHYFPGMWTSMLAVIPALNIILLILQKPLPNSSTRSKIGKLA